MDFAVVIPTKNRPDDLRRILESIYNQTVLPNKIVIVDQSLNKNNLDYIENNNIEIIHYHSTVISGLTEAKNIGISFCDEMIIHFFDDDIILDDNYFELLNNYFENNKDIYGICARQKNSKSSFFKVKMFEFFHRGDFRDIRKRCNSGYEKRNLVLTNILPGGITAYRKEVFEDFSFDENLVRYCLGEDMDFSFRVSKKYKLAFVTDVFAIHNHSNIGRYDAKEAYACKVVGYDYFYKKNVKKTTLARACYLLLNVGTLCDGFIYTLNNKNLNALKGLLKGYKYIKNKYKDVPFIKQGVKVI